MAKIKLKAPRGKTRIIGVDLRGHNDYLVGDYNNKNDAFRVADEYNKKRSDPMDDIYYVYDDAGIYIRGNEEIGQKVSP